MTRRGRMALVGVVLAAAAVTLWLVRRPSSERAGQVDTTAGSAPAIRAGAGATPGSAGDPDEPAPPSRYRTIDADQRLALMQRIAMARDARKAGTKLAPTPHPDDPPPLPGTLSPEQVSERVGDVQSLLLECYTEAVDQLAIKNGQLAVSLKLVGEPEVGTLIETAELSGDPHLLAHADFAGCIQETALSIELPPLAEGSELVVRVAFQFTSDDPRDAR